MRKWHRWAAIPAGIFLFFVSLTGVLLHLDMMRIGQIPPGHEPPHKVEIQSIPSDAELAGMMARIAGVARHQPGLKVTQLQVNLTGSHVTLSAGAGGPPGSPQLLLDAETGAAIITPPPPADFHYVLQDLHAGYFAGWPGRIVSVLCGIALMILAITGLQLWWDMRRRGGKGIYW